MAILAIFVQVALVALVLSRLDMLNSGFRRVMVLASISFVIHHYLPARHRLSFFVLFCASAFVLVLGGSPGKFWYPHLAIVRVLPLALAGCVLIGICLLPIGFWKRAALLTAAGSMIALFRAGIVGPEALLVIWPVLGSLFMFRLIVFLYDVSKSKQRPKLTEALAYFFLFPNSAVTLFPVVDFKTLCRSHYDADALEIYQRGLRWMVRGVVQLMAYRLTHELLGLAPHEVTSGAGIIQYILASTFAYLQVSGLFHLVVGLLLLFGFNLPETNRRYFLAASFTDYWRRVNIYWKDFMLKVFYYPTYFRLKSLGATSALIIATVWSFFVTWALHLYQTWWLKGTAALRWTDVLFWSILAILVLLNSVWELKRGRQRKLAARAYSARDALGLTLRTAGTFACVSVLWSFWSAPSLGQWIDMWRYADRFTVLWAGATLVAIMVATVFFEVRPARRRSSVDGVGPVPRRVGRVFQSFALGATPLLLILVLGARGFQRRVDFAWLQPWHDAINTGDSMIAGLAERNRGYYERLAEPDAANAQLWETVMRINLGRAYEGPEATRRIYDFRFTELIPNVDMHAYDTEFRTNRWGMRDDNYEQGKPPGTFRIALLGASQAMGWGVPHEETFESIVEHRLNSQSFPGSSGLKFEILNFSFAGVSPLGEISMLETRVPAFSPDLVLLVSHNVDYGWVSSHLATGVRMRFPIVEDFLQRILSQARVTQRTQPFAAAARLTPFEPELLGWCYRKIVEKCHGLNAVPVAMFVPVPHTLKNDLAKAPAQTALISNSGFILIDLTHVFDGVEAKTLTAPDALNHMNSRAHRLIADALLQALLNDARIDLLNRARTAAVKTAVAPPPETTTQTSTPSK